MIPTIVVITLTVKHGKSIKVEFDLPRIPRGRLTKVEFDKFIHLNSFFLRTQNLNYEKFFRVRTSTF